MNGIPSSRPVLPVLVVIAALAAVAIVVSGCGGGGSSSSSGGGGGGEGASGAFASGAESACATANKAIEALGTPQQAEVLKYMETTESVVEKLDEEVAGLEASDAAEKAYSKALGSAVITLNHMTNAARNENFDAVREISDELI